VVNYHPVYVFILCGSKTILQTTGQARILREVARQGLLPYPAFFASTKPFGTPLAPVVLKYALTVFVISPFPEKTRSILLLTWLAIPISSTSCSGCDCQPYTEITCTDISLCNGYWGVDTSQKKGTCRSSSLNLPSPEHYCLAFLLCAIFLLIMPWYAIIIIPPVVILISYMTGYPQSLVIQM
jgi:hypothetical protein